MPQIADMLEPSLQKSANGTAQLQIPLKLADGTTLDLDMPVEQVGQILGYFFGLQNWLNDQGELDKSGRMIEIAPVATQGVGLKPLANQPDFVVLSMQLPWANLGFVLPAKIVAKLGEGLLQAARKLDDKTK